MNFSNISLVQNKILCILVFCNSVDLLCIFTFSYFLCAHSMFFVMKVVFFLFCFVFLLYLIN